MFTPVCLELWKEVLTSGGPHFKESSFVDFFLTFPPPCMESADHKVVLSVAEDLLHSIASEPVNED